jgi:hypothetical protein
MATRENSLAISGTGPRNPSLNHTMDLLRLLHPPESAQVVDISQAPKLPGSDDHWSRATGLGQCSGMTLER